MHVTIKQKGGRYAVTCCPLKGDHRELCCLLMCITKHLAKGMITDRLSTNKEPLPHSGLALYF